MLFNSFFFKKKTRVQISNDVPKGQELPPSSLMSFLKVDPTFKGVVLTDHSSEYKNPYYHSRFDNQENINLTSICEITKTIARTIFLLGINNTVDDHGFSVDQLFINCTEIVELYTCFTVSYECPLVRQLNPDLHVGKLISL